MNRIDFTCFYLNKIHVSVWISQILNITLCYEIWALGCSFGGDIRRGCDGVYIWIVNGTLAGETRVGMVLISCKA